MDRGRDETGKRRTRRQHRNHASAEVYKVKRKASNALRPKQVCVIVGPGICYWVREPREVGNGTS